ncbi:pyruvate, phosphate dikinase [Fundicoccus culcitae]|uniref:Pyruvate, phosphate dikinase n=1 Tax=Fundicoccus culcitae TaxID=2969821 RepID=A0ABY5P961_9LACT|nr:pyruvate, phosphate dikinase [Fundicoccus culcitae]UUX35000.1 pyruvate, phosphate dikinase [Fundicoccus culcitae]
MTKYVYDFHEGNATMRALLGGKGSNLAEMTGLGLPVPSGFTISTQACMEYLANGEQLTEEMIQQIETYLARLEAETGKSFSKGDNLLLVSVRSGAAQSMPGMMDTILNLGLNDVNVERFATLTGNPQFAYDCYRRLLHMFGNVVYEINGSHFERFLTNYKETHQRENDQALTVDDLKVIVAAYKGIYKKIGQKEFPQDPKTQLFEAIRAVFSSWNNERAFVYRNLNDMSHQGGTAVNVQEMVFGNSGQNSGTGVAFTRNPSTGENKIFGEYLLNAQGEDVVAGIRTPLPVSTLSEVMPDVYAEFIRVANLLEDHYRDMQDIEFTIENGKLFMLQTRSGKRTAKAAFKIAVDLVNEGKATKDEALMQINPKSVDQLLHPTFNPVALKIADLITDIGLPASPGAATGNIYFDANAAKAAVQAGEKVILVRQETSPEDITGMSISEAVVTSRGGMTSHAAVVARGMGVCCVVGCEQINIDEDNRRVSYPGGQLEEGTIISVDGTNGAIYLGDVEKMPTEADESFQTIMAWARERSHLKVRMNAETVEDIKTGLAFEADGIGLVRTEHMFFKEERLREMRRFILSNRAQEQNRALSAILNYQIDDFVNIFSLTQDKPVVIRLLDPPLHEFMPHTKQEITHVAEQLGTTYAELQQRVIDLTEVNPMLGHRGVRLAVTYPNLYLMQAEAIIRAAVQVNTATFQVKPEIMIPLVGMKEELALLRQQIEKHIEELLKELGVTVEYTIGTMIELPRACLIADQLVDYADFFSFGTNDLTQMTFGFSRDDAGKYINQYISEAILPIDPFQTLDVEGVGELVKIATEKARQKQADFKLGVCGELGGDPNSIEFFHQIGLNYVSCSPYRIPIAQIAAAQSAIKYATM